MTKVFTAQQIRLNLVDLIEQAADPTAGGGTAAAIGSLVLRNGPGQMWLKTGATNIDWSQLVQSLAWYVVRDYGAKGDGVADDTAPIQAAITACSAAGGGVVFFPPGTYCVTQVALAGTQNVQLQGSGASSVIKWVWNAAGAAGSMITVSAAAVNTRISLLRFDGSGLANVAAGRANHLLALTGAGGGVTTTHIMQCQFGGMVTASGDGVHIVGTAGNLVSRWWVVDCYFDGCSRFSVGAEQGWQYGWIVDNILTNCETEIGLVATANVLSNAVNIQGNRLIHAGTVRHALRLEGNATALITRITMGNNTIVGGFCTSSNLKWAAIIGNIVTSGAFASTDAVWRFFDSVTFSTFTGGNVLDRDPAASAGPCISIAKATTAPALLRIGQNIFINEVSGAFVTIVDAIQISVGANVCHATAAGSTTAFGIDVQAVTVNMTDILIGPGNQVTADAGTYAAAVRLLANGANVVDASVVGNQGDSCAYGLQREVGGGGGGFTGQLLYTGNNFDSSTGDVNSIGVASALRVGFNASALGTNLFSGTGSPEGVVSASIGCQYLRTDGGQSTVLYYKESGTGTTGWVGVGGSPLVFGANDLGTAATALFLAPGFIAAATATEIKLNITRPGRIRNFYVQVATAGTDAQAVTYTVRKNGVDTTVTCSKGNATTGTASDLVNSFTVVAGDLISIGVVKAAGVTAGQQGVTASLELV
jgi:Pectate lyase superfamily protein